MSDHVSKFGFKKLFKHFKGKLGWGSKESDQISDPINEAENQVITKSAVSRKPNKSIEIELGEHPDQQTGRLVGKIDLDRLNNPSSKTESLSGKLKSKVPGGKAKVIKPRPISKIHIDSISGRAQIYSGTPVDEADIVFGFDFGTSSSKIVIRDSGRQTAYAVPWGPLACSGNKYLLPTRIFVTKGGSFSLKNGECSFDTLKINLMDNPGQIIFPGSNINGSVSAIELATVYMGLVIRYARQWFLKQTESIYKKTNIYWQLNLGVPSQNYDDEKTKKIFHSVAMAAWCLSRQDKAFTIPLIKPFLQDAGNHITNSGETIDPENPNSFWLHPDYINTHPEVIMEVVGYARSSLRTSGLHLLVDVGATTMDMATFIIHSQEGDDVFPLLETNVERSGTMVLHNRRVAVVKRAQKKGGFSKQAHEDFLQRMETIDPTKPLPALSHYSVQGISQELSKSDAEFFQQCSVAVGEIIRDTKEHRDPYARAWEMGLPVFICGGGGRLPAYRAMIKERGMKITKRVVNFGKFIIKELPKPDQLEAPELLHKDYDRLAVAYGLSFDSFEIGKVIPESNIENVYRENRKSRGAKKFVSKEMC